MNILDRLTSETPVFWKRVQLCCILLGGILGWVAQNIHFNALLEGVLLGACAGVGLFAQFAVVDQSLIKKVLADPFGALPTLLDNLPILLGQVQQMHDIVTKPATVTLNEAKDAIQSIQTPAATNIVVETEKPIVATGIGSQVIDSGSAQQSSQVLSDSSAVAPDTVSIHE